MNIVNWGIIGPGSIANNFASGLSEVESARLKGIASKSDDRRSVFGNKFNVKDAYRFDTYEKLINCDEVDAIYISTPHPLHAEWSIKAANSGKHVLSEKPACVNIKEFNQVLNAVTSAGVFYMEGFMYRCHPQIKKLIEIIKDGKIGDIHHIESSFGFDMGKVIPGHRLFNTELAGGGILDVGLYPISFSRLVAGVVSNKPFCNPTKIEGEATIGETGVDEIAKAKLYFEDEIIADVSTAVMKKMNNNAVITGSKGTITMSNPWQPGGKGGPYECLITININGENEIVKISGNEHLFSFEASVATNAILNKKNQAESPAMTWDDTKGNIETLDLWRESVGYKLEQDNL